MNAGVKWANGMTQAKTWKSHKMKWKEIVTQFLLVGIVQSVCMLDVELDGIDVFPLLAIGSVS